MAVYSSYLDFSLDDAAQALDFIDPSIDYRDWANIGRALAAEFGDQAFDIFDNWSSMAGNYKAKEVLSQWKSFLKSNSVNLSTLIYHARQAGWKPEKAEPLPEQEKQRRQAERQARQLERQQKAEKITASKQRRTANWYTNSPNLAVNAQPSPYQVDKGLADAASFSEYKAFHAKRKKGHRHLMVIPLRDIAGNWRGAELIYAWDKFKDKKTGKMRHFRRLLSGSEPSLGFHVFPNHDALATAKRVFITEGWADGAWAHKATGDVSAYVVGSHNVPVIAALIEQKYPNCQVIVAPDNDKAGNTAADQHGGYWTQPIHQNDWSDVAKFETAESLKAQLLNIRGFKKVYVESRYLGDSTAQILPGLNLIRSAKETGKSTWIIDFLNQHSDLSVLVVSYRKNLVNQLAKKAEVDYYEDLITVGDDPNRFLRGSRHLAISPDSLYKLLYKGTLKQYDVVFIDECDQTLMHYDADTMKHKEKNYGVMSWLLKNAQYQILADADLSEMTTAYCKDIQLDRGQFIVNTHKPRLGSAMNLYKNNMQLRNELVARALKEPLFYCSNSKDRVLEVEQLLIDAGIKSKTIQAVHSGNSGTKEIQDFIVNINQQVEDLHMILASPSLGTGVSIDKGHPFKAVYAEFSHRTGTAEQAHQQMARARGITEYHIWVDPAVNNFETNPDEVRRVMLDKPEMDAANLFTFDINRGEMVAKDELFERLHCRNRAFRNTNKNAFALRFIEQAEAEGYNIKSVTENEKVAELTKAKTEEIRERLVEEMRERIFDDENHPILSEDEFKQAERGKLQVSEESYIKTSVVKTLNLGNYLRFQNLFNQVNVTEKINQLAFEEALDGTVSKLKRLSIVAQSKEVATLRDIEDRKFAESRASLRHFTAQRRHELRFLKAVGIDENLQYDGKEWQSKDVSRGLATYLERNKDEIQAYSGSNITPKTLLDPIRWFVNHLKAMGVPVIAYQKRVNGKQTWFRKIDEKAWEKTVWLVQRRVKGLTKFYQGKHSDLSPEAVTQNAVIYNDIDSLHVTDELAANPVTMQPMVNFEDRGENQSDAPQKEQTPAAELIASWALQNGYLPIQAQPFFAEHHQQALNAGKIEKSGLIAWANFLFNWVNLKGYPVKHANRLFPKRHQQAFITGKLCLNGLNTWAENMDNGRFSMVVGELAMKLRKQYDETLALFDVDHAVRFNRGELTEKDLLEVARSKA